jgi:hypothetical protein
MKLLCYWPQMLGVFRFQVPYLTETQITLLSDAVCGEPSDSPLPCHLLSLFTENR